MTNMKILKYSFFQNPLVKRTIINLYNQYWIALAKIMSDESYIRMIFKKSIGKRCNLEKPKTFNEKLNWMKLKLRNPYYSLLADKYEVKEIVKNIIGEEYVVPNYGVWNSFDEIDFDSLPERFVLKATHDSGGATICKDKKTFDMRSAKIKFDHDLKVTYFYRTGEWVYKSVKHRIIADMLLDDNSGHELQDYKFWCFNGKPKIMYITNKGKNIYENFYDMEFNPSPINHGFPRKVPEYDKPKNFDLMKELAEKLSKGIPFVRIDFFNIEGKVYFGEYTFYDWAGLRPFADEKWDMLLGSWIKLPQ